MSTRRTRPIGISALAVLFVCCGCGGLLAFLFSTIVGTEARIWHAMNAAVAAHVHTTAHSAAQVRTVSILLYALWLGYYVFCAAVGAGLWKLRRWAWRIVVSTFGLGFVCSVLLVAAAVILKPRIVVVVVIVLFGVGPYAGILWYLFRPEVRGAFDTTGEDALEQP